jgi:hypothetical protein
LLRDGENRNPDNKQASQKRIDPHHVVLVAPRQGRL